LVALRGKEIDAFLARPDPGRPIILLYGPDAGLVRERADALRRLAGYAQAYWVDTAR
jgi:DNA polymerase-3 subunit delta